MTQDRIVLVKELVGFSRSVADVLQDLAVFGWDSVNELVSLEPASIEAVLNRFLCGELSVDDVEGWANAIEGRDDIGTTQIAADVISELANPVLTRPLTRQSALALVDLLQRLRPNSSLEPSPLHGSAQFGR